jgi:hypothetical protein
VKLAETLEMLRQTDPKMLLVPHFGVRKDVNLVLDRTKEKVDQWVQEVTRLNAMHMAPEQIVEQLRRMITAETGIRASDIPGYASVPIRTSVLGILTFLKRAEAGSSAPKP